VAVQTAQGCPFHCPCCAVHQLSPAGFRPRTPQQVVDEVAWCAGELGASDVAWYDDALLVNASWHVHRILDGVIERGLRARFHTPNGMHARFLDPPLARKMRRAGFVTIRLGLETIDPDQEARDGGKFDEVSFARAVEALMETGFSAREVAAYVLIGRPGQSVEKARATIDFAHGLGIQVRSAQFSPIPGTEEWRVAVAAGCIAPDADPLLHNNSIYPCADAQAWEELKERIRDGDRALVTGSGAPGRL
jgi:radical SAM superfamily enzyme YgiQ (UPF0313 family)